MVLADCDVDAADLHLVLSPEYLRRGVFRGGKSARIDPEACTGCGRCEEVCRFEAIGRNGLAGDGHAYRVDGIACEGCGVCVHFCDAGAILFEERFSGNWFQSVTRFGPMVHAKLGIAEENSGKLVSLVRRHAKKIAEKEGIDLVLVDGPPGIGCPVIASITGASMVLAVTEPTLSGLHDLERVVNLAEHFRVRTLACVNKFDLNAEMAERIEEYARGRGVGVMPRVPYDTSVTQAQLAGKSGVEWSDGEAAGMMKSLWSGVREAFEADDGR